MYRTTLEQCAIITEKISKWQLYRSWDPESKAALVRSQDSTNPTLEIRVPPKRNPLINWGTFCQAAPITVRVIRLWRQNDDDNDDDDVGISMERPAIRILLPAPPPLSTPSLKNPLFISTHAKMPPGSVMPPSTRVNHDALCRQKHCLVWPNCWICFHVFRYNVYIMAITFKVHATARYSIHRENKQ